MSTCKSELKRLIVQNPLGMAERFSRLEAERDALRDALRYLPADQRAAVLSRLPADQLAKDS